ncbi:ribose-phosphate diphosphokinase [archaeon]|nr:ribose-phosphate diphosphokinase [archaeon]
MVVVGEGADSRWSVVSWNWYCSLGERVARQLDAVFVRLEHKVFPDGEVYVRVPTDLREEVLIVYGLAAPQNQRLVELLIAVDAVQGAGARAVYAVIPYLAYARQDRRVLPGEPISVLAVLKALHAVGVSEVFVLEPHNPRVIGRAGFPVHAVSAAPAVAAFLRKEGWEDAFILAPDEGALDRARQVAAALHTQAGALKKHRDPHTGKISVRWTDLPIKGRRVVVVDDIVSTGGTMARAIQMALQHGAKEVAAVGVHWIGGSNAVRRLLDAGATFVAASESMKHPLSKCIQIDEVLASAVRSRI